MKNIRERMKKRSRPNYGCEKIVKGNRRREVGIKSARPLFRWGLNKVCNKIGYKTYSYVNWWKTVLFNLRCFPLRQALHLPVYIYNNVQIKTVLEVILDAPHIYRGMIRIGCMPAKAHGKTKWLDIRKVIFHGSCDIWGGTTIEGAGTLEFGDNVMLGESCKIMCMCHMIFHDHIRVGYEATFMDTDYHFIIDTETHVVHRNCAKVEIEEGCWISSNCKIMKGTHLPKNSIVVGGSLVNKDFSAEAPCQMFIGTPAKPVKEGKRRVFNTEVEMDLHDYFEEHPEEKTKVMEVEDMDDFCYSFFYRNRGDNYRTQKE